MINDQEKHLVMVNIRSQVGIVCHTSDDQNKNVGKSNFDSNYLNHVTVHL
jgi:hypothetical protein